MSVRKTDNGNYEYFESAETVYMTGDELAFQRKLVELQDRKAAVLAQYDLSVQAAARVRDDQVSAIAADLAKVQAVLAQVAKDESAA